MNRTGGLLLLLAMLAAPACENDSGDRGRTPMGDLLCTEILLAGLVVEVRDAITGEPAAYGAVGEIRDGEYVETLLLEGGRSMIDPDTALRLVGALERAGEYAVVVRKEGYRDWSAQTVVEADECHVHPVRLQAALERQK